MGEQVAVVGKDARLVSVEIRTPAPEADLALLRDLGWREPPVGVAVAAVVPDDDGAVDDEGGAPAGPEPVAVLRSCADPYGVELRLVPGEGPGRLGWRPERPAAAAALAEKLQTRPFGRWVQELRWQVDRTWVGGNALRCPLHAEDSAQLCEAEPPLLEQVALAPEPGAPRAAGQLQGEDEVVVLVVRTPLAGHEPHLVRAPGGWAVQLLPPQRRSSAV